MKLNKCFVFYFIFFSVYFLINSNLFAQDYYPLEIGNRWDYKTIYWDPSSGYSDSSFSSIVVISDSIFSNGQEYYVLNQKDIIGGKYIRADNNYIYYYNDNQAKEDTIINLNAQLNEIYYPESEIAWSVELLDIDTVNIFGVSSRILRYKLDGLILRYVNISEKFGLYHLDSPGEPPGTTQWTTNLYYAIIGGEEFGTLVSVEQLPSIPDNFSLSQNYPNPFNPNTTIKFTIYNLQFTSLKVYDVLGNEIATLVNEEKPAGTYEAEFDATGLPSGVYFYKLQVDNFTDVKKMILVK